MADDDVWRSIPEEQRHRMELGDQTLRRLKLGETYERWLSVGEGLHLLQQAALGLGHTNETGSRAYREAWARLVPHVPHLADLDKGTRSHALWMWGMRGSLDAWRHTLPVNVVVTLNHPRSIRRKYEQTHRLPPPPTSDDTKPKKGKPREITLEAYLRLQEELDALKGHGAGTFVSPRATAEDVADMLGDEHSADWMAKLAEAARKKVDALKQFERTAKARRKR